MASRPQVPCYSYGQKLSKLAILRIACNYILSLARLADLDYSADRSNLSFSECVQRCTRTLQAEGRAKKRKVGAGAAPGEDREAGTGTWPGMPGGPECPACRRCAGVSPASRLLELHYGCGPVPGLGLPGDLGQGPGLLVP